MNTKRLIKVGLCELLICITFQSFLRSRSCDPCTPTKKHHLFWCAHDPCYDAQTLNSQPQPSIDEIIEILSIAVDIMDDFRHASMYKL